jgi:hypothetical protein
MQSISTHVSAYVFCTRLARVQPLPQNSAKAHVETHIRSPVYPSIDMSIGSMPTYRHTVLFDLSHTFVLPDPSHLGASTDYCRPYQPGDHFHD